MSNDSQATPATEAPPKRSGTEIIKESSRALRGSIAEELGKEGDGFPKPDQALLKFHGSYQQEDRDARKSRRAEGLGKHIMFMVRCKIPGGRVTAEQYLALDGLADAHANGTLRITSRQGIQFHGVLKKDLQPTIAGINQCLLSTLGACGDVTRNMMSCPAPHHQDSVRDEMQTVASRLAAHFAPRTGAYHEIWLNGKSVNGHAAGSEEEPIYGKVYLPRKFKMGLALPEDNCVDVYSQDLGLLTIHDRGQVLGYNMLVGGGSGMTHGNDRTFPYLAKPMCFAAAAQVVEVAEAIVKIFRDHGNRADRKRARIKYLVHDWGVEKFREMLAQYLGRPITMPRPVEVAGYDLHLGWHPQGDGKWYYGISIENGRIKDEGTLRLRSGLRAIVQRFQPEVRLTPVQDILLCNLGSGDLKPLQTMLEEYGITRPERLSHAQKYSLACPAIPTCGLAISEAERALPDIIDELEKTLHDLALDQDVISVRMTGCPNGCVRPYQSDVGIVGRSGDKYVVFVGGHVLGHRLSFELADLVPRGQIVSTLRPLFQHYKSHREQGETFGDYCHRLGAESLRALLPSA